MTALRSLHSLGVHVQEDGYADDDHRYRAIVEANDLGFVDASGPTPELAEERALLRYHLQWLGVYWPGMTTPTDALGAMSGCVAMNGHRYALWRRTAGSGGIVLWIMLNPSTADGLSDDPTIRRCRAFTESWGYGWMTVGNLWSWRATDPSDLRQWIGQLSHHDYVSYRAENERWLRKMAKRADLVLCAWGSNAKGDEQWCLELLIELGKAPHALTITAGGEPGHPLRLPARLRPSRLTELRRQVA